MPTPFEEWPASDAAETIVDARRAHNPMHTGRTAVLECPRLLVPDHLDPHAPASPARASGRVPSHFPDKRLR